VEGVLVDHLHQRRTERSAVARSLRILPQQPGHVLPGDHDNSYDFAESIVACEFLAEDLGSAVSAVEVAGCQFSI